MWQVRDKGWPCRDRCEAIWLLVGCLWHATEFWEPNTRRVTWLDVHVDMEEE
jgi:hypothetical protein